MKVRTKLVFLSSALVVLYGLGLLGILAYFVATRFLDVERAYALRDVERVTESLNREVLALGTLVEDWAYWDDLWSYAQDPNPAFEQSNLNMESFSNIHLSFIAIYDTAGNRLFAKEYDREKGLVDCEIFPPTAPERGLPEFRTTHAGFIRTPTGLMLAFSARILKSDRTGRPSGFIIMGRRLDDEMLKGIAHQTGVPFVHGIPERPIPEIPAGILSEGDVLVQADQSGRVIHGFQQIRTTSGVPALIIRTTTERPIAQASRSIALSVGVYSLLLASLVWLVTRSSFRRWISSPLERIESSLKTLDLDDEDGDPFRAMPSGQDELGHIVEVLKRMHVRMRDSHRHAKHLNESLESKVEARTGALVKAYQRLILYGRILENTSEGMLITDTAGTIIEVNEAMCKQSGYSREELIGKNPRILKSGRHGADFYEQMWSAILSAGYWSGEIWNRRPTGEIYPKWMTINAIPGSQGNPPNYVGLSIDISAIKSAEERLHHMAYYDQLTGLPNRALFNDRLRRTIIRAQRKELLSAILFLDLDRFKNINDTLGHTVGDALLVRVAERLKSRMRESDTVCRMGGDEFTVILAEIARLEDAGQVAAELIETMAKRFDINGTEIYVGASVGIALCPRDGLDEETLVKKADAAMYAAKEAGRSTFRFASGELDAVSRKRMEIEARLHGALERNEMILHFQPLARTMEAAAGSPAGLVGAEALLRWVPEPGVVVGPGTFIQIAEDAGLISQIGEWVLREACREARRWQEAGLDLTVSVNVSARQFEDDRLPGLVRSILAETALPPRLLKLEITESAFMRSMDKVIGIMDELRNQGVFFSIDDFGTGYSSLQYIKCLPAHCLKIDKAFISGVAGNLSDAEIVSAIIAMARAFGLKSTAEGVETEDQLQELRERGCDEVQGFLVAKPMEAEAFLSFATKRVFAY